MIERDDLALILSKYLSGFTHCVIRYPTSSLLIKPSLRLDYPLNPSNPAFRPIRDTGR